MGRRSHTKTLSLWSNGQRVGTWSMLPDGSAQLEYDQAWVDSPKGRPISLSLPFQLGKQVHKGPAVLNYFDNLLPENPNIRKRLASRFRSDSLEAFDLLKSVGRDCVGALQILDEKEEPKDVGSIQAKPLQEAEVEHILERADSAGGLGQEQAEDDEVRLSLAGMQDKTALLYWHGQWMRPEGATPTTHILKLPLGLIGPRKVNFTHSVDNEWLCLALMRAFGLDAATASIERFGRQRVLAVERFDRTPSEDGQWLLRLPQEDFCQVNAMPPEKKYESDGGPGLEEIATVLRQSQTPEEDMATLLKAQLLFWMLRAIDGHAKNFSIALLPNNGFHLTPLYDVLSAWPAVGEGPSQWARQELKLAMAVRGSSGKHYRCTHILRRHFNQMARKLGYAADMEPLIEETLSQVDPAIDTVSSWLPPDFSKSVSKSIFGGLRESAKQLASQSAH